MNLGRYWPGYVLGLLAVVGGIAYGFGAAVGALFVGVVLVGPGYLIQQRVRRRRGNPPSGGLLGRDADELLHSLAGRYLTSRRAHPLRWQLIDLVEGAVVVALVWIVGGRTVGIAFAIVWGLLMLLSLFSLVARWRAARRTGF
jgi:hypothetical protein